MDTLASLIPTVNTVMDKLISELRIELKGQGHDLTGALSQSLKKEITLSSIVLVAGIKGNNYAYWLENKTAGANIPFTAGSGAGKSEYITGLYNFWLKKGLDDKEALRSAFRLARHHKEFGRPSKGSYKHAPNNRRTGFVEFVIQKNLSELNAILAKGSNDVITTAFRNMLAKYAQPV